MQVGQKAANLRPVELVVFRVVPDRRHTHLVGPFAQQVSQVRDDGRLRVVAVPVVEHAHGDGKDIGFACGHAPGTGIGVVLAAGAHDRQQHLHERGARVVVVVREVLARLALQLLQCVVEVAGVQGVDHADARSQPDDLAAEHVDQ